MKIKKIKVLHIISSLHQGGAERQLIELVKRNKNYAICQLMSGSIFEEEIKKNKILIFNLNMKKNFTAILGLYKLYRIIKDHEPEIINTWMYHSSFLEMILRKITLLNKIPLVWGLRCSNMETHHYSKLLRFFIIACKYFSSTPNLIINNSVEGKNFHKSIGFKSKNLVIHNGIDNKKFVFNSAQRLQFRKKYKIDENAKVLLCVGRYDPMKDHDTLIKAFKKIREKFAYTFLIFAGSETENIKVCNGIITLGMCKDIDVVYSASDIIISSSAFGEGFSNALAEGMSSSLIPIATNVGDSKIIVGEAGKIVKPRNVNELYLAIKELLEMDIDEFEKKKLFARDRIKQNFSINKMVSAYKDVYKNIREGSYK